MLLFAVLFLSLIFSGCETLEQFGGGGTSTQITGGGVAQAEQPLPTTGLDKSSGSPGVQAQPAAPVYTGPKIKVAVMGFTNDTGGVSTSRYQGGQYIYESDPIGNAMSKQMVTALMQTKIFRVFERETVMKIIQEDELTGKQRKLIRPDYFIEGSVTEFQVSQESTHTGLGLGALFGGGSASGSFIVAQQMAATASSGSDHVTIDVRILDSRTGEMIASISVEGKASNLSGAIGGMFGNTLVGLSGEYKTPIAKASRACIIQAVNWIGDQMVNNPDVLAVRAANN